MKLHLGCGRTRLGGWVNIDCVQGLAVDLVVNLDDPKFRLPLIMDDSVEEIFCSHTFEHIVNVLPLMQDLHRVAKAGAKAIFRVPYGSSDDADEDPTHVRRCFLQTFQYFGQPYYWRADYGYRGDWQLTKIYLIIDRRYNGGRPGAAVMDDIMRLRNVVHEMVVELVAVKPVREPIRELQRQPEIIIQVAQ